MKVSIFVKTESQECPLWNAICPRLGRPAEELSEPREDYLASLTLKNPAGSLWFRGCFLKKKKCFAERRLEPLKEGEGERSLVCWFTL